MEQGVIVPMKESYGDSDGSIEGAYVKPPQVGKHSWIASFDLASLYPSIIMAGNMSPETLKSTMADVTVDGLLKGDRTSVEEGFTLMANGSMYKTGKQGFLPYLMQFYYEQRKVEKKKMLSMKSELEIINAEIKKRGLIV